jgi:hypothetical protein
MFAKKFLEVYLEDRIIFLRVLTVSSKNSFTTM